MMPKEIKAASPLAEGAFMRIAADQGRQSLVIGAGIAACLSLGTLGACLGAFTLWQALTLAAPNFLVRGLCIEIVASLLFLAAWVLWPVRQMGPSDGNADLVKLGLARSVRELRVIRVGLAACATTGLLGVLGSLIRYAQGNPPSLSPAVSLSLLAGFAVILLLGGSRILTRLRKFAALRALLRRH